MAPSRSLHPAAAVGEAAAVVHPAAVLLAAALLPGPVAAVAAAEVLAEAGLPSTTLRS
jgi:hypothetical protein